MSTAKVLSIEYFLHPPELVSLWRGEVIPAEFDIGFDKLNRLDREWIWVAKRGSEVVGALLASPAHGAAIIWRLVVSKDASSACVLKLLRQFMRDCKKRGLSGYITLVQEPQARLEKLMLKFNGTNMGKYSMIVAPLVEVR